MQILSNPRLPPSDATRQQALKSFIDDWPEPEECIESEDPSSIEVKKWRLQILLAVNPFGIPSVKYGQAYERMFRKKFDLRDFGCDNLTELTSKMPDIFAVQEPDEMTAILFPESPYDRVLHDARLGLNFAQPRMDDVQSTAPTSLIQAGGAKKDFSDIIMRAWMDRDEEFPPDVVLAGESYENLLKVSSANIPGTKGLYQATILSTASPESIFIQLKSNDEDTARVRQLSDEIAKYFKNSKRSIDAYNVPKEFMLPGFPCLLYLGKQRAWERCIITGRSRGDNKVLVESIDFGGTYAVHQIYLYLIPRKFLELPRQTLHISLMGLKPKDETSDKWPKQCGSRLRCFSFENYWLDVLLIEPKIQQITTSNDAKPAAKEQEQKSSSSSRDSLSPERSLSSDSSKSSPKRKFRSLITYEALIVDRNDKEMDLFLDEILILETYARPFRAQEVAELKKPFIKALESIPRPKNPFE